MRASARQAPGRDVVDLVGQALLPAAFLLLQEVRVHADGRIQEVTAPFAAEVERLATIPGVSRQAAEVLIAEVGVDMTAFPTAGHLCSWAGMSPGNNQSAGKRLSGRTTKGNAWLRSVLVQALKQGWRTLTY